VVDQGIDALIVEAGVGVDRCVFAEVGHETRDVGVPDLRQ
jgi:hypothetical protein